MTSIEDLTRLMLAFRDERQWAQFHNPKDVALSLTLEAAELLELMQWRSGEALMEHLRANREALADELADVLGWVLVLAHDQGINLGEAVRRKIEKNAAKYPVEKARGVAKKYDEL
jgi:dCTP diphosphatase